MTRVIHTGDTHIGYRQYHSPERRQDFLDAFEAVVADAVDEDVDAVVHAGDLFHDRRPDLPDLLGTLSALRRLDDAGVPFLAVVGNHESTRGGQWLDLFESLGLATRLDADPVVVGDTAFYGLDHVPESRRDRLEYDFASPPAAADTAALVSHGLFEPFAHANWDTETVLTESSVDFDAVLLGDNHAPGTAEVRGTWVTYCGSTERASATERDGRGYNIVTFDADRDGDAVDIRRRALDTRPFVFIDAELGPSEGVDRVRDRVREHDVDDAVVIVEITGDGDPVAPAAVEEFAAERGALIVRVKDRREVEADTDVSVNFADPDAAVRERVSELGLSTVARDIDDVVRGETADANVRDDVKQRIQQRLDDADTGGDGGGDSASDAEGETLDSFLAAATTADDEETDRADEEPDVADNPDGSDDPDAPADSDADDDSQLTLGDSL
ncbi:DNA double-strand break repair protein Mre11 [Halobaculum sp. D14]|uniref:DNA double-strand break repair protein Mre11 n=1 Tax=Halobaculum sp. D14 TaxID=3421642 RepID=UPI003EBAE9AB